MSTCNKSIWLAEVLVECNCLFHISAYIPSFAKSSSCVPCSATIPSFRTIMLSALRIVPNRCAMTSTVRWEPSRSRASCTLLSVSVSNAEVASSKRTNGGSFNKQRAIAARCFSPPLSLSPRSPTTVSHPRSMLSIKSRICASCAACSSSS
mmetsp:Transcript_6524/g.13497  ORF Transcript_6524/g.13497 Transcript_6524/m.13497 type:complete len:151 (-) Transcript_6524:1276-1728(-)